MQGLGYSHGYPAAECHRWTSSAERGDHDGLHCKHDYDVEITDLIFNYDN